MATREVRCTNCGTLNRVPRYSIKRIPWCGKCRTALPEPRTTQVLRGLYQHRIQAAGTILIGGPLVFYALYTSAPTPIETCANVPDNGAVLSLGIGSYGPHRLEIANGTSGNAIIKVRDVGTGHAAVALFVASDRTAYFNQLPDGAYRVQWVIGRDLAADCQSFTKTEAVDEFDETEILQANAAIEYNTLKYTLYAVPGGNARSHSISLAQFNAD